MTFLIVNQHLAISRFFLFVLTPFLATVSGAIGQESPPPSDKCASIGEAEVWLSFDHEDSWQEIIAEGGLRLHGKPVLVEGKVGKAFALVGAEDGIAFVPHDTSSRRDITVETWLRTEEREGTAEVLRWEEEGGIGLLFLLERGRPVVGLNKDLAWEGEAFLADGRWHHLALVMTDGDSTSVQILIDGDPVSLKSMDDSHRVSLGTEKNGEIWLGGSGVRGFIGTIDEFTIHRRSLRRTEVVAIWAAEKAGKCR